MGLDGLGRYHADSLCQASKFARGQVPAGGAHQVPDQFSDVCYVPGLLWCCVFGMEERLQRASVVAAYRVGSADFDEVLGASAFGRQIGRGELRCQGEHLFCVPTFHGCGHAP